MTIKKQNQKPTFTHPGDLYYEIDQDHRIKAQISFHLAITEAIELFTPITELVDTIADRDEIETVKITVTATRKKQPTC